MVAKELYEEFSPVDRKANVLGPCHGWGGRLVGALLADVASYTGVDPSEQAHEGVMKIAGTFGKYSKHTDIDIRLQCFEDTKLDAECYDIALTSPPYFDVEKYEGEDQSHKRYPQYSLWVDRFYTPLIVNTFTALRGGGVFILQVGSQSYPLREDAVRIAEGCGFIVEDIRPFTAGTRSGFKSSDNDNSEKIIILRKP